MIVKSLYYCECCDNYFDLYDEIIEISPFKKDSLYESRSCPLCSNQTLRRVGNSVEVEHLYKCLNCGIEPKIREKISNIQTYKITSTPETKKCSNPSCINGELIRVKKPIVVDIIHKCRICGISLKVPEQFLEFRIDEKHAEVKTCPNQNCKKKSFFPVSKKEL